MASLLSPDYDVKVCAANIFNIVSFIGYGDGMQKSVRGNFFKYPDLEPNWQTSNAKQLLADYDAVTMATPGPWEEWIGQFMKLRPGRDHLMFQLWNLNGNRDNVPQRRFQIKVWRYGHRKKHTQLQTTLITIQSYDDGGFGKDLIQRLFDNYGNGNKFFNVDIK